MYWDWQFSIDELLLTRMIDNLPFITTDDCAFIVYNNGGHAPKPIEIINNTREGIVIFFRSKKGNALLGGKSSPGYFDIGSRAKDLRSFHRVFIL